MNGLPQTEATVTILDAMAMFSHWHADVPSTARARTMRST